MYAEAQICLYLLYTYPIFILYAYEKPISTLVHLHVIIGPIFLQAIPVQAQKVLILYFCFFFKDNKAHNVHNKDVHYQNLITKPHTLS